MPGSGILRRHKLELQYETPTPQPQLSPREALHLIITWRLHDLTRTWLGCFVSSLSVTLAEAASPQLHHQRYNKSTSGRLSSQDAVGSRTGVCKHCNCCAHTPGSASGRSWPISQHMAAECARLAMGEMANILYGRGDWTGGNGVG
jgi:hypothetical protein